jgi:ubiquinone biosynthesis protein
VRLPALHPQLCTERVLVMERLDGLPLDAAGAVIHARGLDRVVLARALLGCLLRQIMLGGVFHADPHPGNILLLDDGRLGLLDFGSVGRLDALLRSALQQFLLAIDRGDPAGLYDALLEVMVRPDDVDEQRLQRALGQFMARHLNPGAAADVETFTDLFRLVASYQLMVPPEVAAVFRALATLEATLAGSPPASTSSPSRGRSRPPSSAASCSPPPCGRRPTTSCPRCCRCCAASRAAPTASPTPWSMAASAWACGCSPTRATAGS